MEKETFGSNEPQNKGRRWFGGVLAGGVLAGMGLKIGEIALKEKEEFLDQIFKDRYNVSDLKVIGIETQEGLLKLLSQLKEYADFIDEINDRKDKEISFSNRFKTDVEDCLFNRNESLVRLGITRLVEYYKKLMEYKKITNLLSKLTPDAKSFEGNIVNGWGEDKMQSYIKQTGFDKEFVSRERHSLVLFIGRFLLSKTSSSSIYLHPAALAFGLPKDKYWIYKEMKSSTEAELDYRRFADRFLEKIVGSENK